MHLLEVDVPCEFHAATKWFRPLKFPERNPGGATEATDVTFSTGRKCLQNLISL